MRAYFDVTHPAHVHLFRPAIERLARNGHEVLVGSREKEMTTDLLDAYGIEHTVLSTKGESKLALASEWGLRELRTIRLVRRFDPDVVVSQLTPSAVHAARMADATSVVFHDSEFAGALTRLVAPVADVICSPAGLTDDLGDHHRFYEGFHELAYLHPSRFEPDEELLRDHGVDPESPYSVLRFVSMGAYHDVDTVELPPAGKRQLATELAEHGPVYVSSEGEVPTELPAEPVPVPPEAIHHLLAGASTVVGDSNTMAIEAAILGTPTVRLNYLDAEPGVFRELHDYGLVQSSTDGDAVVDAALSLADDPAAGERWRRRRLKLLSEKIDVSSYILETVREAAR